MYKCGSALVEHAKDTGCPYDADDGDDGRHAMA